jgi:hypothetical protein
VDEVLADVVDDGVNGISFEQRQRERQEHPKHPIAWAEA